MQIDQDSSIDILHSVHLHILHIFQMQISLELMQIFANGKQHFYSFIYSM